MFIQYNLYGIHKWMDLEHTQKKREKQNKNYWTFSKRKMRDTSGAFVWNFYLCAILQFYCSVQVNFKSKDCLITADWPW
jgi:hypothetical protein